MDIEQMRKKVETDSEMTPEQFVQFYKVQSGTGGLSVEMLDFMELYNEELQKDIETLVVKRPFWKVFTWPKESPVVRAYLRYMKGERLG